MDQVYWISTPVEPGSDERTLVYRYGRFVYAGEVATDPVASLRLLPRIIQGVQAVQGEVPYRGEYDALPETDPVKLVLRLVARAVATLSQEVTNAEGELAALADAGSAWLLEDDCPVYFEFAGRDGYDVAGADVVFAKHYAAEVLITAIWYGPARCWYVTLTPTENETQALVDTLFPAIYGKRRGSSLKLYEPPPGLPASSPLLADADVVRVEDGGRGKEPTRGRGRGTGSRRRDEAAADAGVLPLERLATRLAANGLSAPLKVAPGAVPGWRLFVSLSVWEASEPVPDPDDEGDLEAALLGGEEEDSEDGEGKSGDEDDDEEDEGEDGAGTEEALDLSGGSGYTQVYMVARAPPQPSGAASAGGLAPRPALFRFGDWVYAGDVLFPPTPLRLGDVPQVLPAVQKQQGRLAYLSEAKAIPSSSRLTPALASFMRVLALLQHEMEDCADEVAALADQSLNAWIDEEWSASFFELAFAPDTVPPPAAPGSSQLTLGDIEVVAAKVYLSQAADAGLTLHVVWFGGTSSLYCVLAALGEDLPLLDVAFPDVTARNRVVQVRSYGDEDDGGGSSGAKKGSAAARLKALLASHTLASTLGATAPVPVPRLLRIWEGRRRGIKGVGYGAAEALAEAVKSAGGSGKSLADELREKARAKADAAAAAAAAAAAEAAAAKARAEAAAAAAAAQAKAEAEAAAAAAAEAARLKAEAEAQAAAAAAAAKAEAEAAAAAAAARQPAAAEGKGSSDSEDDDLYDVSGLRSALGSGGAKKQQPVDPDAAWRTGVMGSPTSGGAGGGAGADAAARLGKSRSAVASTTGIQLPFSGSNRALLAPLKPVAGGGGAPPSRLASALSALDDSGAGSGGAAAAPWDAQGRPISLAGRP